MKALKLLAVGLALGLTSCSLFGGADTDRDSDGQIVESGDVGAFNLKVGDCVVLNDLEGDTVTNVPGVPCSEAHDAEVIDRFDVVDLEDYDVAAVTEQADAGCTSAINRVVGPNWSAIGLVATYLYPVDDGWTRGDRRVTCLAVANGLVLTSSVAGTGN